jgi:hypothetical protein
MLLHNPKCCSTHEKYDSLVNGLPQARQFDEFGNFFDNTNAKVRELAKN